MKALLSVGPPDQLFFVFGGEVEGNSLRLWLRGIGRVESRWRGVCVGVGKRLRGPTIGPNFSKTFPGQGGGSHGQQVPSVGYTRIRFRVDISTHPGRGGRAAGRPPPLYYGQRGPHGGP